MIAVLRCWMLCACGDQLLIANFGRGLDMILHRTPFTQPHRKEFPFALKFISPRLALKLVSWGFPHFNWIRRVSANYIEQTWFYVQHDGRNSVSLLAANLACWLAFLVGALSVPLTMPQSPSLINAIVHCIFHVE